MNAETLMDSTQFKASTSELMGKLDKLPEDVQKSLRPVLEKALESHRRRQQLIAEAMQALVDLRLHMKYLLFDLEATRRENQELKQRLGEA